MVVVYVRVRGRLVVIVGGHIVWCVQRGHWWWSGAVVVVCVDGGGKEKGSHVTHRDNGITFVLPREITCKCLMCK